MPKHPLPVELSKGIKPVITQEYGETKNNEWYKKNGVNFQAHYALDIITSGGPQVTYGTKMVCPVPFAYKNKAWFSSPMNTKGNGIEITWKEGNDKYDMLVWHCSEIVDQPSFKLGEAIAYIGNSGLVSPPPTPQKPFDGSHTHLAVKKNGVTINPEEILDRNKWFTGEPTPPAKDLPPLTFFESLLQQIIKLQKTLSTISRTK